jgi:hypothetical protein
LAIFSFPHEIEILTESFFSKNKKFAKLVEIRHKKEFSHWVSSARQKSRYMQFVNAKPSSSWRDKIWTEHISMILLSSLLPQCCFTAEIHLDRIPKPTLPRDDDEAHWLDRERWGFDYKPKKLAHPFIFRWHWCRPTHCTDHFTKSQTPQALFHGTFTMWDFL